MSFWKRHQVIEKHATGLLALSLVVVSIGGAVEIAPLFYLENTIEEVEGMRQYTPLELAGRRIYMREGCYTCHSQMIRPFRDETERYGHFSLAAESMFDHPFQWGSKRTGPDLARVGGLYSDAWHLDHLRNPRDVVPESIMPAYGFLESTPLDFQYIADDLRANQMVGVPYTEAMIQNAALDLQTQARPNAEGSNLVALRERYGENVLARAFDGDEGDVTEADALIAYLQMLGTLVDFSTYDATSARNRR